MNLSTQRTLKKISVVRSAPWLQANRYSGSIDELYLECKTIEQLDIVGTLLKNFNYVNAEEYLTRIEQLKNHILDVWNLNAGNTLITAICDNHGVDGSQLIVGSLRNTLPSMWAKSVANNINSAFQTDKNNIVLVDDFTGTGEKLAPKIVRLKSHLDKKQLNQNIYMLSFAGMKVGLDRLREVVVDLYSTYEMTKAITDNIHDPVEKSDAINAMIELEQEILPVTPAKRNPKFIEYNFGYGASEAIFYAVNLRTPNNVFPIFWKEGTIYHGQKRNPIFRR